MDLARFLPRLVALPAALLALAFAAGRDAPREVPLALSDSLTLTAPASLAGRSVRVTLDTGAGVCRFAPSLLGGASPAGKAPSPGRPGEPASFDLARVPSLAIGEASWAPARVASWPLLDEMHVEGVVSARLFDRTPVTIDLPAKKLVFETPETLRAREAAGFAAPLLLRREGDAWLVPLARAIVDGAPRLLVLDTGLPGAPELEAAAGPHAVALGGFARTNVEAYKRATPGADGRLGLRFFEGRAITLDLPGSRIIVSR